MFKQIFIVFSIIVISQISFSQELRELQWDDVPTRVIPDHSIYWQKNLLYCWFTYFYARNRLDNSIAKSHKRLCKIPWFKQVTSNAENWSNCLTDIALSCYHPYLATRTWTIISFKSWCIPITGIDHRRNDEPRTLEIIETSSEAMWIPCENEYTVFLK